MSPANRRLVTTECEWFSVWCRRPGC